MNVAPSGLPSLLADGRAPPISAISHSDVVATVYNLSIRDIHTYYVGPAAVLVHNSCGPTGQLHHLLSNKVMKALATHPNLAGKYLRDSTDFVVRAANAAAHSGYQNGASQR
jgi:hypothetical protein